MTQTTIIRGKERPAIGFSDIQKLPTIEGPVKDTDFGCCIEALNDHRLTTPEQVHLFEGVTTSGLYGYVEAGAVILFTRQIRRECAMISKVETLPEKRVMRLLYRHLLNDFKRENLGLFMFFNDKAANTNFKNDIFKLKEEHTRNARISEVLPYITFPDTILCYKVQHRDLCSTKTLFE